MSTIDFASFLDPSPLTCVEYQVFLDEQRDRGIIRRPDHWLTDRYPTGEALVPVLGVRPADSIAFCAWLSNRHKGGWQYHIPTRKEYELFRQDNSMTQRAQTGIGCWIDEGKDFVWLSGSPPNATSIHRQVEAVLAKFWIRVAPELIHRACRRALSVDLERSVEAIKEYQFDRILDPLEREARTLSTARYYRRQSYAEAKRHEIHEVQPIILRTSQSLHKELSHLLTRETHVDLKSILGETCTILEILGRFHLEVDLGGHTQVRAAYEECLSLLTSLVVLDGRIRGTMRPTEGLLMVKSRI